MHVKWAQSTHNHSFTKPAIGLSKLSNNALADDGQDIPPGAMPGCDDDKSGSFDSFPTPGPSRARYALALPPPSTMTDDGRTD